MDYNALEELVIKTISLTGISRTKELKEIESLSRFSYKEIVGAVKHLIEINILNRENVYHGGSARHNFYVFELSDKGKELAESLTNKKPIISQKEVLLKEHGNLEIAYLFEDCVPFLKEKGILLEKTGDSYTIEINGTTYPIFLDASITGRKMFSREEYVANFDKMRDKNATFYYLSTNMISSSFLILDEIEAWIKNRQLNNKQQEPFQFKTSFMGRIFEDEGEKWDTLTELWMDGMTRFSKAPSVLHMKKDF